MDVALPFVESGLDSDESTLVAVQGSNVRNLRDAVGNDVEGLTLLSVEDWYETSARTRDKVAHWASEHTDRGPVRVIGEPPWAIGHDAQVRDWARHESVINVAFDRFPATFICPYDARVLPDEVLSHAHSTHPEIVDPGGSRPSEGYEDPRNFCRRLDTAVELPAGAPTARLSFELADLPTVRGMVEAASVDAGLPASRVDELILAVNEIATNAVVHGRPPASLRIWNAEGELICEVTDAGEGIEDVLAGQLRPWTREPGGRGLWLTRMLCDAVEIRNGSECTVAIHATVPNSS